MALSLRFVLPTCTRARFILPTSRLSLLTSTSLYPLQLLHLRSLATRSEMAAAAASKSKNTDKTSHTSDSTLISMRNESEALINALLIRIEKGILDGELAKKNKGFKILREQGKLTIDTGPFARSGGTVFTLEADLTSPEQPRVSMTSLKNSGQGYLHYKYDKRSGHWINESDSHYLLELLVRDLTHHCAGFPVL